MRIGIGIDTGGTFTDIAVYDYDSEKVLVKGKTPTTKEDLEICINKALDIVPEEYLREAVQISLSTTLATNSCVEDKGSRARLVIVGTTDSCMQWISADSRYGLRPEDVLAIDAHSTYDGTVVDHPDWDAVTDKYNEFFSSAQALACAEVYAMRNAGAIEKRAKEYFTGKYPVPFVMGNELATDLNVMERGATAWLNARLLNIIREFTTAVDTSLEKRNVTARRMVVRSDGSLMDKESVLQYPVRTILSGPAASIVGGNSLAGNRNCLIVDMGGTTTDVSIIKDGVPFTTRGIKIGRFTTQVPGVFIDTFGLGGDSRITMETGVPSLNPTRVRPLCMAASEYPQIKEDIKKVFDKGNFKIKPLYEAMYLLKEPSDPSLYDYDELKIIDTLRNGPIVLGTNVNYLLMKTERLENEGIVMRCGMTPTDFMHLKGDFDLYDTEASRIGARYMLRALAGYEDTENDLKRLCDDIYELVERKVYDNLVRILLTKDHPEIFKNGEISEELERLIHSTWDGKGMLDLSCATDYALVGIGAPTHLFLPKVAEKLKTECVIPENSEVANALGAALSDIRSEVKLTVAPNMSNNIVGNFIVYFGEGYRVYTREKDAIEDAKLLASELASNEARKLGALGELRIQTWTSASNFYGADGSRMSLRTDVYASALAPSIGKLKQDD